MSYVIDLRIGFIKKIKLGDERFYDFQLYFDKNHRIFNERLNEAIENFDAKPQYDPEEDDLPF